MWKELHSPPHRYHRHKRYPSGCRDGASVGKTPWKPQDQHASGFLAYEHSDSNVIVSVVRAGTLDFAYKRRAMSG
ncbi:MAG TPA: hypothetical protein DC058_10445 [Planctomycetaceae bacterium]|nr:hypothetical protein [Planctomycetaceae bacterium]HBC61624.1 hypothetical protein [Planctomycetaceae bacterium]